MSEHEVFDLVVQIGEIMLKSGGEISRTSETMERIAKAYAVEAFSVFTIANGIFASATVEGKVRSAVIKYVPLAPIHLCRVEMINHLSREIVKGCCPPKQAQESLLEISSATTVNRPGQIFASGLGSGCFCYIFGGSVVDCSVAFFAGLLLYVFLLFGAPKIAKSKIMSNILGSAIVTIFCWGMLQLGWGSSLDKMIIGSIVPLLPGVPFVNSIRNFFDNDYLSGMIRLVDTILVAVCIASGVGLTMQAISLFTAGGIVR